MKLNLNIKDNYVKGVDVNFTPSEFILFHTALKRFQEDSESIEDTVLASEMLDTIEEQIEQAVIAEGYLPEDFEDDIW